MRMTASWSGHYDLPNTRLWRDDRARWQAPPLIIVPTTTSVAAVLVPVKARPGNDGACGQGRATADLDRPCARRPQHVWVGAKKRDSESNKETGMKEVESGVKYMLAFKSPIQALLGLHFVTTHRIAQQPKAAFVAGLRPNQLPGRAACQLPDQSTIIRVRSSLTDSSRPRGARSIASI